MFHHLKHKWTREDFRTIAKLPFVERVTHSLAYRPLRAVVISGTLMVVFSGVAMNAETICHIVPLPHVFIDATAYFFHGVAGLPLIKHFEPLMAILVGEIEGE